LGSMDSARIYLSPPDIGEDERMRVLSAIDSGWVAPIGPDLESFEDLLAKKAGRKHAVALSSGTAALHLGLLALGVSPGDFVICSTLTFVATANAILYVGAIPVFVDSDPQTGNMSITFLEKALRSISCSGGKIAAVIPVDFLGAVADYETIQPLCQKFGIPVLADAAESLGSTRDGRPSGAFGDASIFSFNGNKIATTSGGGAFLSDDESVARKVRFLATQAREPVVHYEHKELGFNYRLSNVLAAIGVAQLGRLDHMVEARRQNRERYRVLFANRAGVSILGANDAEDNCWLTAVLVDSRTAGFSSAELAKSLEDANIESRPLWKPMHRQPLFESCPSFVDGTAERLFASGLALPSGSALAPPEWRRISAVLQRSIER